MKTEIFNDQTMITVTCPLCKKDFCIVVNTEDWSDFQNKKKLIQHCFPYLSANVREQLQSGICGECWNKVFKDVEE